MDAISKTKNGGEMICGYVERDTLVLFNENKPESYIESSFWLDIGNAV